MTTIQSTRSGLYARASLAICLLIGTAAQAQLVPMVRSTATGGHDVLLVEGASGSSSVLLESVQFLSVRLAGRAPSDRLLLDRPQQGPDEAPAHHVLLPQGGALYLISRAGKTALLHVRSSGEPVLRLELPDAADGASLRTEIAVAEDGSAALLASRPGAGGDVWLIDLIGTTPARLLTGALPPLDFIDESLRVSTTSAFVVAADELLRADLTQAAPVLSVAPLPLPGDLELDEQLVLAAGGRHVAVFVSDDADLNWIIVAPSVGPASLATPSGGAWDAPSLDHPLGPWVAINEDGSVVAFREFVEATESIELHVAHVAPTPAPPVAQHLTAAPAFPAYIDNVGVLGFVAPGTVSFFAGDVKISGLDQESMIGAADFFKADVSQPGSAQFQNVTVSGSSGLPPYDQPGVLAFSDAFLDPLGQRWLLASESEEGTGSLTLIDPAGEGYGLVTEVLLSDLDEDPRLIAATSSVLVVSGPADEPATGLPPVARLDLVRSKHHGVPALVPLAVIPDWVTIDRFSVSMDSGQAAFVAGAGPGLELPVRWMLPNGPLQLAYPFPTGISPGISFDGAGRLVLGLGVPSGPYVYASLGASGPSKLVGMPVATGFPLAH